MSKATSLSRLLSVDQEGVNFSGVRDDGFILRIEFSLHKPRIKRPSKVRMLDIRLYYSGVSKRQSEIACEVLSSCWYEFVPMSIATFDRFLMASFEVNSRVGISPYWLEILHPNGIMRESEVLNLSRILSLISDRRIDAANDLSLPRAEDVSFITSGWVK